MPWGNRIRSLLVAAVACLAVAPAQLRAQETPAAPAVPAGEPVLVVSIASVDRMIQDVNYVSGAVGQAQGGGIFAMMAANFTNGLDRSRPIGLYLAAPFGERAAVLFLPTSNVKQFLKTLEPQLGPADEFDDGTLAIAAGTNVLYIRQQGNWAYAAQTREALQGLPNDPLPWLQDMGDDYNIGVRVNVQAFTPEQRQMFLDQLRQGFDQAIAQQPAEQADQIRQMGESSLEQLEMVINDTEILQLGFAIEPQERQLRLELLTTAAPGTKLARMYAAQQPIPSKFASVIQPDAAAYFHGAGAIGRDAIEQTRMSMQQVTGSIRAMLENEENLSAADRQELEAFFERLIEIAVETIGEGKSDGGALLTLENDRLNAVAGFFVSDGAKVAQLVKDLAAKVQDEPEAPKFTFDAGNYKDVTLHYVDAAVPEDKPEARQIFGETLRLTIGTAPDAVYLALGQQSEPMLRNLIDQAASDAGGERPLSQGKVSLLPILQFAQAVKPNDQLAAIIDKVARAGETANIRFVTESIERGSKFELTIGEGILRAIGAAIEANQQRAVGQVQPAE
ncbi:hypothetical protein [Candidatus Laterigemmans baculatus]|nr:hypothetical protein [Candidatus Laterigemmans baculatus]